MKRIYCDTYNRRRIMDKAARHLKYNDGIKDIVDKIKSKISDVISQVKSMPRGDKIAALLSAIESAIAAVLAAKSISNLIQRSKKLIGYKKALKQYTELTGDTSEDVLGKGLQKSNTRSIIVNSIALILSLVTSFILAVNTKILIAKKQVTEGEDEARVVTEVMTR